MPEKTGHHPIELVAEVQSMELDLKGDGSYRLLLEDGSTILANFCAAQLGILQSQHNKGRYKLKVVGIGDFADGRLQRIVSIDLKKTERVLPPEDPDAPTLFDLITEIHSKYPKEIWDNVPIDASENMHHYLYGRPRTSIPF